MPGPPRSAENLPSCKATFLSLRAKCASADNSCPSALHWRQNLEESDSMQHPRVLMPQNDVSVQLYRTTTNAEQEWGLEIALNESPAGNQAADM